MRQIIFALAAISLLATVIPAKAGTNCTTTCNRYSCNTHCW
jgi:hypothetical protein